MGAFETYEDYDRERGKPLPSLNHGLVQSFLGAALLHYRKTYSIVSELNLNLNGRLYVPDISIYPKLPLNWQHDHMEMTDPPLTVIEILSSTQSLDSLVTKAEAYFEAGVQSCWIVQMVVESVVVLVPGEKPTVCTGGGVMDPATGITVEISEIFPSTD